jgi:hypothetical protein
MGKASKATDIVGFAHNGVIKKNGIVVVKESGKSREEMKPILEERFGKGVILSCVFVEDGDVCFDEFKNALSEKSIGGDNYVIQCTEAKNKLMTVSGQKKISCISTKDVQERKKKSKKDDDDDSDDSDDEKKPKKETKKGKGKPKKAKDDDSDEEDEKETKKETKKGKAPAKPKPKPKSKAKKDESSSDEDDKKTSKKKKSDDSESEDSDSDTD